MRVSQQKHSRWLYTVLALVLLTFIGLMTLPLLNAILDQNQSSTRTQTASSSLSPENAEELALQEKGYELVVQREQDNITAWRGLLDVRLAQGNLPGAIAALENLTRLNPERTDYQVLLAQAQQQTNDYEGAAQTYRTILATYPTEINALQGLVNLLLQQNRPEAAVGLLEDSLEAATQANSVQSEQQDIISIQLLLGQVYASQSRNAEAVAVYEQAMDTNPEDFRPVLAKALILKEQEQYADARPLLMAATTLAPARYKDQIQQFLNQLPAVDTVEPEEVPTNE